MGKSLINALRSAATIGLALLALCCTGCGNRYESKFTPSSFHQSFSPVVETKIIDVGHVDPNEILRRDFASETVVGTSVWVGNEAAGDNCKSFAKKIGADLVLWGVRPHSSRTSTRIDAIPNQQTTYQSGGGTVSGNRGNDTFNYTGSSTTYGKTYVESTDTVTWHEFTAIFLRTSGAKTKEK